MAALWLRIISNRARRSFRHCGFSMGHASPSNPSRPSTSWPSSFSKARSESQKVCRYRTEVNRERLMIVLFGVEARCGFGFLLPFICDGVLLNQSIQRVQELAAPAEVINLVHILS